MARTSDQLTVDYKTIMSIPPRDRRALLSSGTIDPLLGVLTPGQRVALFPDYFKQQISGMAGQRSEFPVDAPRTPGTNVNNLPPNLAPAVNQANNRRNQNTVGTGNANVGTSVDDPRVRRILGMISRAEGTASSYDTQFGYQNVSREATGGKPLTKMTINEVRELMRNTPANKRAMGMYQFVPATFDEVVSQMGLTGDELFDPAMQDKMIVHRLNTTRGMQDFLDGKIPKEKFAQNLAYEFASLPSAANGGRAAYGGVGLNTSNPALPLNEVLSELEQTAQMPTVAEGDETPGLAQVADDTQSVTGEDASAVPEAVMRTGGIPIPAAMSAVDRALTAVGLDERENKEQLKKYLNGDIQDPATQAWCASFVNAALASSGLKGTDNAIANSFQTYGVGVDFDKTQKGDIVIETRGGNPNDPGGHVMMATGRTRINEDTGQLEVEIVGGNQSDAVTTRYVSSAGLMIRRATEANLAEPPPGAQTGVPQSSGAEPIQTAAVPPAPQTDVVPETTYSLVDNVAEVAGRPGYSNEQIIKYIKKGYISGTTLNQQGQIVFTDRSKAEQQLAGYGLDLNKLIMPTAPGSPAPNAPVTSMAAGGILKEPHTAVNNRTGEVVNLGEVGTGGEAIVPMNKVKANEVGQQPYQMPVQAPAPDARMPKQADVDKKEPAPKNATGQQTPTNVAIAVDHQVVPPSARKAYADAGLEHRFNNFSSLGTQYRNFGL